MTKKQKRGCLLSVVALVAGVGIFFGPALVDLFRAGILQAFFEKDVKRTYVGTSRENLKALYTGLMLYHESEGQFPAATGWMDAVKSRIQTNDLSESEAAKKFIRPGVTNGFGYALNDKVGGQYKGDIEPQEVVIFESDQTAWNAHGKPSGMGINLKGDIVTEPRK